MSLSAEDSGGRRPDRAGRADAARGRWREALRVAAPRAPTPRPRYRAAPRTRSVPRTFPQVARAVRGDRATGQ
ncbi:hypothetical protein GCM10010295_27030 [Streptomyces intermedius]